MNGSLSLALRDQITALLAGETPLPDFQDWLIGATWNVEEQNDPRAIDMTYEIKLAMAEHARGDISLEEFHERLQHIVESDVQIAHVDTH
jgi:hypothetical protein